MHVVPGVVPAVGQLLLHNLPGGTGRQLASLLDHLLETHLEVGELLPPLHGDEGGQALGASTNVVLQYGSIDTLYTRKWISFRFFKYCIATCVR